MLRYTTLWNIRIQKSLIQSVTDGVSRHVLKLGYTLWYLSVPESRSMEPIIVMCCCHNSCCPPYCQVAGEFLIVPQRTGCARWTSSLNVRLLHLPLQICGHPTTPTSMHLTTKSGASASLDKTHKSAGCGRFEAASDWCLGWNATKRYWRCHWVALTSPYLHSGYRRTFWILTVTHESVKTFASLVNFVKIYHYPMSLLQVVYSFWYSYFTR